jgi:photosystem II stability/assembly factor-like uncharacterized protein
MKKSVLKTLIFTLLNGVLFAQSWVSVNTGSTSNLLKVTFLNENKAIAVGYEGTTLVTNDAGLTWSTTSAPTNVDYFDVKFIDENVGFLSASFGRIFKTTNGGSTWVQKNTGTSGDVLGIAIASDGQTIYAISYDFSTGIVKSTDAGETWSSVTVPTAAKLNAIAFSDNLTGYVVGDLNSIFKTTNGGVSWTAQSHPYLDNNSFFSLSVLNSNTVFSCGGNQRIMKTVDGTNWTSINNNQATGYRGTYFSSESTGYVVGAGGKILKTTNGGSTFTSEPSGVTSVLFGITQSVSGVSLCVGFSGVILRKDAPGPNTAPTTQDDVASTAFNTPVTVNVLANDTDADGSLNPASVTVTVPSPNGTTSVNTTTGAITFTPTAGFSGNTTFTYEVCDNGSPALCATAVVTITVGVNSIEENTILTAVYPNPVNSVLTIESKDQVKSLRVISLDGKEMLHAKNAKTINVEQLAKGIYTLEITFEGNSVSRKEFVKD